MLTVWLLIGIAGFGACVITRTAIWGSPLHIGALAVGTVAAVLILVQTVFDGQWLPWFIGLVVGSIGWTTLDRAARRRGRRQ